VTLVHNLNEEYVIRACVAAQTCNELTRSCVENRPSVVWPSTVVFQKVSHIAYVPYRGATTSADKRCGWVTREAYTKNNNEDLPQCLPFAFASSLKCLRALECTTTGFLMIRPCWCNRAIFRRLFAREISLVSLGSSQILFFPHFRTDAARRFCSLRETNPGAERLQMSKFGYHCSEISVSVVQKVMRENFIWFLFHVRTQCASIPLLLRFTLRTVTGLHCRLTHDCLKLWSVW